MEASIMNRSELVSTLELVAPALSDTNMVPVYTCFAFCRSVLSAYNDSLGIVTQVDMDGVKPFAVSGMTLLGLLMNSHAEEVTFQVNDENVIVKAGKSVAKLPYFTEKEFLFEEPKEKWSASLTIV